MGKIDKYRSVIVELMQYLADIRTNRKDVETQFNVDKNDQHYQLVNVGWMNGKRIYGCFLHVDIKEDGKVWIQHDGTDIGVAAIFVEKGIPKTDIVLGFQPQELRKFTDFAIN